MLRIITANVNGIRSAAAKGFYRWLARQRADIVCMQEVKAHEADIPALPKAAGFRCATRLDPQAEAVRAAVLRFLTPTELKAGGQVVEEPEFRHLFARIRDRIAMLSALYGAGPLSFDFQALGERADSVALERSNLTWEYAARKSKGTGQMHPLGGFTGTAEYRGTLGPFLPWLRVAQWAGVGRQTVWGKGDVRLVAVETEG